MNTLISHIRLVVAFILLSPLSVNAQVINGTISSGGQSRNYIVYLPAGFSPATPRPLVFVLHGFTQSASNIMSISGFNAIADTAGFVVAYPNGVGNAWNTNSGMSGGSTADDIGFIANLTDTLQALYNIDPNRVFSCGFSAGGYMSHRLACESPRCYAAIASVAGTMSTGAFTACQPSRPVPVTQIHGTTDFVVSYNGGFGGKSVNDVINLWVNNNNCPSSPVVTALPDISSTDQSTVELSRYSPCAGNTEVQLYKVNGGGHQWPGSTAILGGVGATNQDINASAEIWKFFRNYSCASPSTGLQDGPPSSVSYSITGDGSGNFEVNFSGSLPVNSSYRVYDISGRVILEGPASERFSFSLKGQPRGAYVLNFAPAGLMKATRFGY